MTTSAYVLEHNKRRLLILLGILALILFFYGIRSVFEGLAALIGSMPGLLVTLIFYAFAFIAQFGALMWFLSRPRTYTVTPDDPQLGLSFNDYRGQPDLVDHAKTLVRILGGVERFKLAGGEMPKGMLLSGQPGTGKTFLAGVIAAEAKLPFIYIDAGRVADSRASTRSLARQAPAFSSWTSSTPLACPAEECRADSSRAVWARWG